MAECMGGSIEYNEGILSNEMSTKVKKLKAGKHMTCVLKNDMSIICNGKQVSSQLNTFN